MLRSTVIYMNINRTSEHLNTFPFILVWWKNMFRVVTNGNEDLISRFSIVSDVPGDTRPGTEGTWNTRFYTRGSCPRKGRCELRRVRESGVQMFTPGTLNLWGGEDGSVEIRWTQTRLISQSFLSRGPEGLIFFFKRIISKKLVVPGKTGPCIV